MKKLPKGGTLPFALGERSRVRVRQCRSCSTLRTNKAGSRSAVLLRAEANRRFIFISFIVHCSFVQSGLTEQKGHKPAAHPLRHCEAPFRRRIGQATPAGAHMWAIYFRRTIHAPKQARNRTFAKWFVVGCKVVRGGLVCVMDPFATFALDRNPGIPATSIFSDFFAVSPPRKTHVPPPQTALRQKEKRQSLQTGCRAALRSRRGRNRQVRRPAPHVVFVATETRGGVRANDNVRDACAPLSFRMPRSENNTPCRINHEGRKFTKGGEDNCVMFVVVEFQFTSQRTDS